MCDYTCCGNLPYAVVTYPILCNVIYQVYCNNSNSMLAWPRPTSYRCSISFSPPGNVLCSAKPFSYFWFGPDWPFEKREKQGDGFKNKATKERRRAAFERSEADCLSS